MPEPQERVLNSYIALREKLKGRHAIIRGVIADATQRKFVLRPTILGELCYLQLRMICELIALGCLLVHGDIPAARAGRIQKAYAADWIINKLTALHPSFYPVPTDQVLDETGRVASTVLIAEEYLTKEKLIKLYAECGTVLHRGTLKGILSPAPRHLDMGKVGKWATKITHLLNHHQVPLIGDRRQIWVVMNARDGGNVQWFLMERLDDPDATRTTRASR
jgi:hypothetical protein